MVTGVLFLMLVVFVLLLAAFIYQIIITPLTAVDAPTVIKSAAVPSGPAPPLPVRQPRVPAATGAARGTSSEGASRRARSWSAALAIADLAAVGGLFLHIAPGGPPAHPGRSRSAHRGSCCSLAPSRLAAPSPWPASALSSSRSSSPCADRADHSRRQHAPPWAAAIGFTGARHSARLQEHTNGIGCPVAG
jgi:hypothetical protein